MVKENDVTEPLKSEDVTDTKKTEVKEELIPASQVSGIVAKEVGKATEKMLKDLEVEDFKSAKEGLTKLKEIRDSEKTELQKKEDELKLANGTLSKKDEQIFNLEAKLKLATKGIDSEYIDDILILAKSKITEDVDFDKALEKVISQYGFGSKKEQIRFGVENKKQDEKEQKEKPNYI